MLVRWMYLGLIICFLLPSLVAQNESNKYDYQWLIGIKELAIQSTTKAS